MFSFEENFYIDIDDLLQSIAHIIDLIGETCQKELLPINGETLKLIYLLKQINRINFDKVEAELETLLNNRRELL